MTSIAQFGAVALTMLALAVHPTPLGAQTAAEGEPAPQAQAQRQGESGLPLPRFVSLRAPKVNLRTGPGVRYPIDWVYNRAGLPLEIIDEFETWRRVRDWEGSEGWVHQSMLSGERKVMVRDKQRLLRDEPDPAAAGVALLAPGVIAALDRCIDAWCQIEVQEKVGWLRRIDVYGLYPKESVP
jgi:SH3-like domain-containing protein